MVDRQSQSNSYGYFSADEMVVYERSASV